MPTTKAPAGRIIETLVKYGPPVQIVRNTEKIGTGSAKMILRGITPCPPLKLDGEKDFPPGGLQQEQKRQEHIDPKHNELMNSILPPRTWTNEKGLLYVQQVSTTPSTREEVVQLQKELDLKLRHRQARETGICPVRRELYGQLFDEIIRQVAINCAERGLMLMRVRDELRMTLAAYQTLYESAIAFGIRKALQAEHTQQQQAETLRALEKERSSLEKMYNDATTRCEMMEKKWIEAKAQDDKHHQEEINFLKKNNQQLKVQIEGLITTSHRKM